MFNKKRLKDYGLKQQDLMVLLGHRSKTHMAELMNGICPFTLNDLVIINRLFKIELSDLVPTTIPQNQRVRIRKSIQEIGSPKIKLTTQDFDIITA